MKPKGKSSVGLFPFEQNGILDGFRWFLSVFAWFLLVFVSFWLLKGYPWSHKCFVEGLAITFVATDEDQEAKHGPKTGIRDGWVFIFPFA